MRTLLISAPVLLLAGLAPAQTGTYTTFGAGCAGSAGSACASANTTCTAPFGGGNSNIFALILKAPKTIAVLGMQLKTMANPNPGTIKVELYLPDAAGKPKIPAVASGMMTIGKTYQFYSAKFNKVIPVLSGKRYFISFSGVTMRHPICRTGGTRTSYYWHPPLSTTWRGTFTQAWTYKVNCAGGGGSVPVLSNTGVPAINKSFSVNLSKALAGAPAALITGAAKGSLDLTPFGAPGCSLLASLDILVPVKVGTTGTATIAIPLPNNTFLVQKTFFQQWLVFDKGANALGVALSQGGQGLVGR